MIDYPVGYTCPDIDSLKNDCERYARDIENSIDSLNCVHSFLDGLAGIHSELEDLRRSNEKLREWGEKLYEENEELKTKIRLATL